MSPRPQPPHQPMPPQPPRPPRPPGRPPHGLRWRLAGLLLAWLALAIAAGWGLCQWLGIELDAVVGPGTAWPDSGWWRQQHGVWSAWQMARPLTFLLGFMALFTLLSALALPGCAPLALLAGTAFGAVGGTLLVGLASTLGATIAFLVARHALRSQVRQHLGHRLQADAVLIGVDLLRVPRHMAVGEHPVRRIISAGMPAAIWPDFERRNRAGSPMAAERRLLHARPITTAPWLNRHG
mgnify:CR=1 FL=1